MNYRTRLLSFALVGGALSSSVLAGPYDDALDNLPSSQTLSGQDSRTAGTVMTYNIPTSDWPETLDLNTVRGGDGGRARAYAQIGSNQTGDGGGGALITAQFQIDPTATGALRPGGVIRFIVGNQGESNSTDDSSAAGGGGGTAVLYRAPEDAATWEILVVAGGGGGGASSTRISDTFGQDGRDASITVDGSDGKGQGNANGRDGGIDGGAGVSSDFGRGGGGGSYHEDSLTSNVWLWDSAGRKGGNSGGNGGVAVDLGSYGGFGYGSGGGSFVDDDERVARGGGGGGYSGGGAGGNNGSGDGAGGGGGSFVNAIAISSSINSRNGDRENGTIIYEAQPTTGLIMPGPTISLNGDNPLNLNFGVSYSESGFSALDVYGNEAAIDPTISGTVDSRNPGTYIITYGVTDVFGNRSTETRSVVVGAPNPPTFTVGIDIEIAEDSGAFSQANFITGFSANDPGDSLLGYTVTNNNNALFSAQPLISNSGALTFAPALNQGGTATVAVVATDTNEFPEFADSAPVTFEITITPVEDPPVITPPSSLTVAENSTASFAFSATDPLGGTISYQIIGDDAEYFSIDDSGPSLNFISEQDYEDPVDADGDNVYEVTIVATGSDGTSSEPIQVQLLNVSQTPTNLSLSENRVVEGNQAIGVLSATTEEGEIPAFTISGGANQSDFMVSGLSLLFVSPPDHENPGDNVYHVELVASSGGLDSAPKMFAITVYAEDNEAPDAPGISNGSVPENTQVAGVLMSSDPNGDVLSYLIQGGADGARFEILNGDILAFVDAPDFENPTDDNGDNLYVVNLVALDGVETSEAAILQISVSDLFDEPATDILFDGESVDSISLEENLPSGTVVATLSAVDSEIGDSHVFTLSTTSSGRFDVINGNELIVTGAPMIDYESDDYHVIRIRATDKGGTTFEKRINIPVIDIDETSVLQREDFTLDTNTNSVWLHPEHSAGLDVSQVESRRDNNTLFGTDHDWQFATWDEVMEFYKNASLNWVYDARNKEWAFLFSDDYFNQDEVSNLNGSFGFDTLALNSDGSYGRNKYEWVWNNPRILYVSVWGDEADDLKDEIYYDHGVRYVQAGSPFEDLLRMEGAVYTGNSTDMYMIVDRSSGVGFEEWASGQELAADFAADDNGDGRANGLDYIFGDGDPLELLGVNTIAEPSGAWHDVALSLEVTTDFTTWTEILRYEGGVISFQNGSVGIDDGVITYGDGGGVDTQFFRWGAELLLQE